MKNDGRAFLMKTSKQMEKAAYIYPRFVELLNEADVSWIDRCEVVLWLQQALAMDNQEPPHTGIIN